MKSRGNMLVVALCLGLSVPLHAQMVEFPRVNPSDLTSTKYRISSCFGPRMLSSTIFDFHNGMDFYGPPLNDDPVYALEAGKFGLLRVDEKYKVEVRVRSTTDNRDLRYLHMFPSEKVRELFLADSKRSDYQDKSYVDVKVLLPGSGQPVTFRLTKRTPDGSYAIVRFETDERSPAKCIYSAIGGKITDISVTLTSTGEPKIRSATGDVLYATNYIAGGNVLGPVGGSGGYAPHLHLDCGGSMIYQNPLWHIKHEEGGAGKYSATLFDPSVRKTTQFGEKYTTLKHWIVEPRDSATTELRLGISFSQTGDLDRVRVVILRPSTGAPGHVGTFVWNGATPEMDQSGELESAVNRQEAGTLPLRTSYEPPNEQGGHPGWLVLVSRKATAEAFKAYSDPMKASSATVLVEAYPLTGTPAVFEFPVSMKPKIGPFVSRLVAGSASQYEGAFVRKSSTSSTTLELEFVKVSNEAFKEGTHPVTVEFSRAVISASLFIHSTTGITGKLFSSSVASTVWHGSITIPRKKGTKVIPLEIRARDEFGMTLALVSRTTSNLDEVSLEELPLREATDTRHEITINIVVPDNQDRASYDPTPKEKAPKGGINLGRLSGYKPWSIIMPDGMPALQMSFGNFGSFRGVGFNLCNIPSNEKPDSQAGTIAAKIAEEKQRLMGDGVPEHLAKVKLLSFGEQGVSAANAVTQSGANGVASSLSGQSLEGENT